MNRIRKYSKKVATILIISLCINTYSAIVSDNDGSAFITKGEFDSLKNNFQTQIDKYNTSIDSKIDGAIASYLAGINITAYTEKTPMFISIYGNKPTFHHDDKFNETKVNSTNNEIKGSYGLNISFFAPTAWGSQRNGYTNLSSRWVFPKSTFNVLHKLKWDKDNGEWIFDQNADDADVRWTWIDPRDSYNKRSGTVTYVNWCWNRKYNYNGITPQNDIEIGTRGDTFNGWSETSASGTRSYSSINTSSQPSWSNGSWSHPLRCKGGLWTEIDSSAWDTKIKHLWVTNDVAAIERKFDLTSDENHYLQVESADPLKVNATAALSDVAGAYSDPKYEKGSFYWKTVYAMAFHGWEGDSTYNVLKSKTRLKPSEVKYVIKDGLKDLIKLSLWNAPLFDKVDKDAEELKFDITLSDEEGYDNGTLYFSKETWASDKATPSKAEKIFKNNETRAQDGILLEKGKKVSIKLKNLKKDELLFFSIVPEEGKKAKIEKFENLNYKFLR